MNSKLLKLMLGFTLALAFFIPIWKQILPLIAGLLAISYFITGDWKSRLIMLKRSSSMLALIGFYLFNVIGMIWTQNYDKGWLHLEIKLSLLLFPFIIFARPDLSTGHIRFIRRTFIFGSLASALFLISRAFYIFIMTGENHFSYESFSPYFHPSYLSMYFLLAAFMLYEEFRIIQKPIAQLFPVGIVILITSIILLSSKINLLILLITLAYFFITAFRKSEKKAPIIIGIAFALTSLAGIIYFVPAISERVTTAINVIKSDTEVDANAIESTSARLLIWESALDLIKENPMGVGVGDVNIELTKQYQKNHFSAIESKQLNAHNQFLQTTVALGYIGLVLLLLVFLVPLRDGILQNNRCLVFFIALFFINALVEGVLETQTGILFFAFFLSVFQRTYAHE